jgi:tRNA threonylcarbamoyl adenosine modification protein YjeE
MTGDRICRVSDLLELDQLASQWISLFRPGDWINLKGEMGAGKTAFVRAMMRAWGWSDPVPSPTFPIMIEYDIQNFHVLHIDAFRLSPGVFEPWDWKNWSDEIVFVEWAEKTSLPAARFNYEIEITRGSEETERSIALRSLKR